MESESSHPEVVSADADEAVERAAAVLAAGGLVAIPTETVYGLAADAANREAVERIFRVKGRPSTHPLIVHLPDPGHLERWATDVPDDAHRLAAAFWPGPLTLVLRKHPAVLDAVTGGRDTVAVRVPAHPSTLRVLAAFGGGLAAPSANRFGHVSPTTAAHVVADLGDDVDLVVDGGPCGVGVESTIVEVVTLAGRGRATTTILRPGRVTSEELAAVVDGDVETVAHGPARAPGMLAAHYAPATPVELWTAHDDQALARRVAGLAQDGERVGVVSLDATPVPDAAFTWHASGDPLAMARLLYGWLRAADDERLDRLVAILPPAEGIGVAICDRLRRAATPPSS